MLVVFAHRRVGKEFTAQPLLFIVLIPDREEGGVREREIKTQVEGKRHRFERASCMQPDQD